MHAVLSACLLSCNRVACDERWLKSHPPHIHAQHLLHHTSSWLDHLPVTWTTQCLAVISELIGQRAVLGECLVAHAGTHARHELQLLLLHAVRHQGP